MSNFTNTPNGQPQTAQVQNVPGSLAASSGFVEVGFDAVSQPQNIPRPTAYAQHPGTAPSFRGNSLRGPSASSRSGYTGNASGTASHTITVEEILQREPTLRVRLVNRAQDLIRRGQSVNFRQLIASIFRRSHRDNVDLLQANPRATEENIK